MENSQRKVLKAPSTQAGDMQLLWETQLVGLLKHGNWEPSANLDLIMVRLCVGGLLATTPVSCKD
jgi:hypothetical protein